jgi:hypothetical protein
VDRVDAPDAAALRRFGLQNGLHGSVPSCVRCYSCCASRLCWAARVGETV